METPTYEEAIYMANIKRQRAMEAIDFMMKRYSVISLTPAPGMEVLLDYFVNMVYALELVMKVLAKDWDVPGKSKYRHDVGEMYRAIFGRPHSDPAFMRELQSAIVDQKFNYEPVHGLINRIECMEDLWDELRLEYARGAWGKISTVNIKVKTDPSFAQYLVRNVARFTKGETHTSDPMTTQDKIAMKKWQIEQLQREVTRLETEGEKQPTMPEICAEHQKRLEEEIQRREEMMRLQFHNWGYELQFMIYVAGVASFTLS